MAWRLIAEGDVEGILLLLRNHIVTYGSDGRAATLNGTLVGELAAEVKVMGGLTTIAGFRVLAVDHILAPDPAGAATRRVRRRAARKDMTAAAPAGTPTGLWDAARDSAPTQSLLASITHRCLRI